MHTQDTVSVPEDVTQSKINTHGNTAGKNRKNELSERQSKKHIFRVLTDFFVDLNFQNYSSYRS